MWYVVVAFLSFNSDGSQNLFVFNKPIYENFETCASEVIRPAQAQQFVNRLLYEYKGRLPGPIEKVSCVPEHIYNQLQDMDKEILKEKELGVSI